MIADTLEAKNAKEVIKAKRQENICLRYHRDICLMWQQAQSQ